MIGRIALGGGIAAAAAAGVGLAIARRLTSPTGPRAFDLTVRGIEHHDSGDLIVLDRTDQTTADGIYNLWFEHGGWAQLSTEIIDRGHTCVARRVTGTTPDLAPGVGDRASWSGIYYATPANAGLRACDITITTPTGRCPTWRIDGDPSLWAIHIHGLGSTRAGTLRDVRVATELGYTSLVVSYRNTAEGPHVGTGRVTLGHTETSDVDEAIGCAVRRGAQRIVLFGWSMGAAIALQLADRPRHEGLTPRLCSTHQSSTGPRSSRPTAPEADCPPRSETSRSRGSPSPHWHTQSGCRAASPFAHSTGHPEPRTSPRRP